jgi:hypothetical protein
MSVGSHYSRDSTRSGASSSHVDEAYRRLGRRLSLRAHGDEPIMQPQRLSRIGLAEGSMFAPYGEDESWGESQEGSDETNPVSSVSRISCVGVHTNWTPYEGFMVLTIIFCFPSFRELRLGQRRWIEPPRLQGNDIPITEITVIPKLHLETEMCYEK